MLPARPLRLLLAPALALTLSGCPTLTERAGVPPSVDRAEALERSGDAAGAARVYEALAAQNNGSERNELALRAARGYLAAHRAEDAARSLAMLEAPLSAEQATERSLSSVELALERGQAKEAWQQLSALPEPRAGAAAARYRELLSRAALAAGHPGSGSAQAQLPVEEVGPHIALLLPITGRTAAAASSVRDGFLTAYYQNGPLERPRVRVYDTGTQSVAEALALATRQGADFIVGPLTREEVVAAADVSAAHAPLLALNFLPADRPAPPQFYQYALSPEDEARLAARRILDEHHRRGVALVPVGDWGDRVLAAFKQELLAGSGELLATATFDASRTDYSGPIKEVLGISDSTARFKHLEAALGTKLQFEPRRRGDIEFIFAPAQAGTERLLRPQLRFHYAGDIPTYATSDAFEPDVRANEELDGLMFPDMPWILGGDLADAVRSVTRAAWPSGGPLRGRLFAFGFDAFRLAQALRRRGVGGNLSVEGLTGRLSLDAERRVRREISWAQVHNGELRILPAPGAP
ncbi:MAG TPA: penicillin-binding protein activator [Steroidobacteraceae bacterium]|nr:penicillin-binding protein activator [Steroidobacteraceae bacterium]